MEILRRFLHPHPNSEKIIDKRDTDSSTIETIKSSHSLLDQLKVEERLLEVCKNKFGKQDYITSRTVENIYPWVVCSIGIENKPGYILEIGVLTNNYQGMSNQICISEEPREKGKDYFKQATILLGPNHQEVFERQGNGQHQTTNDWINQKLSLFINSK